MIRAFLHVFRTFTREFFVEPQLGGSFKDLYIFTPKIGEDESFVKTHPRDPGSLNVR